MYNDKRIGVCVSSYIVNDVTLDLTHTCVERLVKYSKRVDEIWITDDCSPHDGANELYNYLNTLGVIAVRNHKNRGIGAMKNLGLRLLDRCGVCVLMDNDTMVKAGWDEFYVKGLLDTEMHHLHLCNIFGDRPSKQVRIANHLVNYHRKYYGAFMIATKEAVQKVGGFPLLPMKYGAEHYNWQVRLGRAFKSDRKHW